MTPDLEALARRAVACKAFRWMPGMRLIGGCLVEGVVNRQPRGLTGRDLSAGLPDFSEPPTAGCLLALVREAWGRPGLSPHHAPSVSKLRPWNVVTATRRPDGTAEVHRFEGATEAEALVLALEAAP